MTIHKTSDNGVDRDSTPSEIAEHIKVAGLDAERIEKEQSQAAARATGLAKLKALGLTDAEVAALVGG